MIIPYQQCRAIIQSIYNNYPRKVLHIGAHHAEEAEDYKNNGVEEVIWVESNESLIPALVENIKRFGDMRQQVLELTLWNRDEVLKFNVNSNSMCSSILELGTHLDWYPGYTVAEEKSVQAHRLDTILNDTEQHLMFNDFEFINIDTQGAELAILEGFGDYIKSPSIKGIYLEVNVEELYKGGPMIADLDNFLNPFGYVRVITGICPHKWGDALWIKPSDFRT